MVACTWPFSYACDFQAFGSCFSATLNGNRSLPVFLWMHDVNLQLPSSKTNSKMLSCALPHGAFLACRSNQRTTRRCKRSSRATAQAQLAGALLHPSRSLGLGASCIGIRSMGCRPPCTFLYAKTDTQCDIDMVPLTCSKTSCLMVKKRFCGSRCRILELSRYIVSLPNWCLRLCVEIRQLLVGDTLLSPEYWRASVCMSNW